MNLDPQTDLSFTRTLAAPRQLIWECWTTPEHIKNFFIPKPHRVTACDIDLRVGGRFNTTFEVEGNVMENTGVYLEIVPGTRLVFTAQTTNHNPRNSGNGDKDRDRNHRDRIQNGKDQHRSHDQ